MEKFCPSCGQTKSTSEFNKQTKAKDGLQNHCRDCQVSFKWRYRYGIDRNEYNRLLEEQSHRCAACGILDEDYAATHKTHRYLVVDHCHETGKVRGLLCNNCNIALGAVHDRPEVLQSLIRYLKQG